MIAHCCSFCGVEVDGFCAAHPESMVESIIYPRASRDLSTAPYAVVTAKGLRYFPSTLARSKRFAFLHASVYSEAATILLYGQPFSTYLPLPSGAIGKIKP